MTIVHSSPRPPHVRIRTATVATVSAWIISIVVVTPTALFTDIKLYNDGPHVSYYCSEFWSQDNIVWLKAYDMVILFCEFIIPIAIMCFCYLRIGTRISEDRLPSNTARRGRKQSQKRMTRLLVIIVIIFVFCWMPFHAYTIFRDFFPLIHNTYVHSVTIFYVVEAIAMANSMANTIIYVGLNKNLLRKLRTLRRRSLS
ncbi:prokineticin receptor 2-like [Saccoglossus kowalevskii]